MSSGEEEFEGDAILPFLRRPGSAAVVGALIGCLFYRNDPDALEEILGCDTAGGTLVVRKTGGTGRRVAIRGGYILSTDGLLSAAINSLMTDVDRQVAEDERLVAAFGISRTIERDELPQLAQAIRDLGEQRLRSASVRGQTIMLARKYGSTHTVLKFTDHWRAPTHPAIPADVLIEHVATLRELNDHQNALAATELLRDSGHGLTPKVQSILYTQRAAVWLDLFDVQRDPELLVRARECAKRSWAIAQSSECNNVYHRLKRFEQEQGAEEENRFSSGQRQRLADAEAAWEARMSGQKRRPRVH